MKKYLLVIALFVAFHEMSIAQQKENCSRNPHRSNRTTIEQGRQNGTISQRESRILNLQRKNVNDMRNVAKADGRVSRNEKQLIQKERRQLNRNIQRANNNSRN